MQSYLKASQVGEDRVVLITRKGKFEGWARLIETDEDGLTFYEGETLLIKQRWLVEWLDVKLVRDFLSPGDRLTQINLAGNRTHRNIVYLADRFEDRYNIPNLISREDSDFNMNDDFGGVF